MSYHIEWVENDVIITFSEDLNFAEVSRADDEVHGNNKFSRMNYQLWDFRKVNKFNISVVEAKVIGELDKSSSVWNDNVKVAIVSTNKGFKDMILEYMKILEGTNWRVKDFKTLEDARNWCDANHE